MKKVLLLIALYLLASESFASAVCSLTPGGVLDQFQSDFYNQAQQFAKNVLPTVQGVYWLLFTLWCAWELSFDRLMGLRIDKLYVWWVYRVFVAYTIQHVFLDPSIYVGILKFGSKIGSIMGGFNVNPESASPLGDFTPSSIMGVNNCVAVAIKQAQDAMNPLNVLGSLELWMLQMGFFLVTSITAFYVLYISIKMWLAMFAGFINTMFAGSSWTVSWWQAYLSTVIKYALELVFVAAMFGVVHRQLDLVVVKLTNAGGDAITHYVDYILAIIELGFMTYLMMVIPKELAGSLGGSFGGKIIDYGGQIASRGINMVRDGFNGGETGGTGGGSPSPTGGNRGHDIFRSENSSTVNPANPKDWPTEKAMNVAKDVATGQHWKAATEALKNTK